VVGVVCARLKKIEGVSLSLLIVREGGFLTGTTDNLACPMSGRCFFAVCRTSDSAMLLG
jgi:hypothetical protein